MGGKGGGGGTVIFQLRTLLSHHESPSPLSLLDFPGNKKVTFLAGRTPTLNLGERAECFSGIPSHLALTGPYPSSCT